jgi:benzylsuccinate CoA-transferase BbsF subunit
MSLSAKDVEVLLQGRAIPASAVKDSKEVCLDEQLAARGYLVDIEHPISGRTVIETSRFILSRPPAVSTRPAPTIGGDNQHILNEILGYDEKRITELATAGALQ